MKKLFCIALCFTLILSVLVGCATSKKPAPKPAPSKQAPPPKVDRAPKKPSPTTPKTSTESHKLAKKLADSAEKVYGVKSATVVVSDSTAFVGLEINPDIESTETNKIKNKVADTLKKEDKSLKTVNITTDPNLITRLKKIAKGVEEGKPISSFSKEMKEITRRMLPKTK